MELDLVLPIGSVGAVLALEPLGEAVNLGMEVEHLFFPSGFTLIKKVG